MSDDSSTIKDEVVESSKEETAAESLVSRKAYEQVTADLHKNKKAKRDLLAKVNQLEAEREAELKAKMEEKQQFEQLYKKAEEEKQALIKSIQEKERNLNTEKKKTALKQQLGNIKDTYIQLANLDAIELNEDGTVNSDTLLNVANNFKQEHPQLIPSEGSSKITEVAPSIDSKVQQEASLIDLSEEELMKRYAALKNR